MSYRSLKRVLGETSLERKCRFLFGGCLLLLIAGSFLFYGSRTEKLVYQQNRENGRLLVQNILISEHWENLEVDEEFRKIPPMLSQQFSSKPYDWRFISRAPDERPQDEREWAMLTAFEQVKPSEEELLGERLMPSTDGGHEEYQYYHPVYMQQTCVECHNTLPGATELAEGDLYGVLQVRISNVPTQRALNMNRAVLLATAIATVTLAMIAAYVIVRYVIVKPLKHLRDVSDEIRKGNTDLRAEIHTGDEFEELAVAFNRMLRHLVAVQDAYRSVNNDLDSKIDELAQANMQLFDMNRLKSDFLATMSHELRTPLNSIIGFSEVLSAIDSLNEQQKRYVLNIQKSGKVLLDMINDILDLAKIESGKMELRLSDFRVEHVVLAQCDMARPLSERKNIDLTSEIAPALPELHQDQGKLQQILNNLLSNAIKFTPEGGRIVVTAKVDRLEFLVLEVADTGVGISEEDRHQIFEKFRQGKTVIPSGDAMKREYSGTGLGLSIVKELCKLLGGEISLSSELGKGSTFTVRVPVHLSERPKLDSPLAESLYDMSKPRRRDFATVPANGIAERVLD